MSFRGQNKDSSLGMILQPNVEVDTFRSIWEERSRFTSLNRRLSRWFGESRGTFLLSMEGSFGRINCYQQSSFCSKTLHLKQKVLRTASPSRDANGVELIILIPTAVYT